MLASRGSTTLKLVSANDLRDQANHTLWLATRKTADPVRFEIAAATGGNHAVLRFDDGGHLLARTRPELYFFTNGIWLANGAWWTTDTNHYVLRKLDADSLQQTAELPLSGTHRQRYLGAAVASHGEESDRKQSPLATLFRLQSGMAVGRVVDVFPDGSEREYRLPANAEPMDVGCFGEELLIAEGAVRFCVLIAHGTCSVSLATNHYAKDSALHAHIARTSASPITSGSSQQPYFSCRACWW